MVIADVSGKGAAAALVTASVQAIVRTHAATFTASLFTLPADSVLVLYTDGVTERRGAGDAEYGDARLLAAIQTGMQGSASQIVGAIVRDNDRFAQLAAADDDLTVLVAKRRREIRKSYRPTTHAYRHRHRRRSDARRRAALSLLFAGHSDFANSRASHDPATSTLSVRRDPCGRLTTM
jgi:Stage II sporulation protein E (SpoIIE)